MKLLIKMQALLDSTRKLDFLAPLALRLYLAPIFFTAGMNKFNSFPDTVQWFGDMMDGRGLPFPTLMAGLVTGTELVGAVALVLGLGLRWMTLPMMFTMIVAIVTVHWPNGWLAIAEGVGPFATERTMGAIERLNEAKDILMQHGDYDHLTENGSLGVLNIGIEFAATYLIMLLSLFFTGAGRYFSVDYWIRKRIQSEA